MPPKQKMKPTVIRVDGTRETLPDTKLETLQKAVGGMIEIVDIGAYSKKYEGLIMIVNENGICENLPVNKIGTAIWIDSIGTLDNLILGDIIICEDKDVK